jgi:hypothetical protein
MNIEAFRRFDLRKGQIIELQNSENRWAVYYQGCDVDPKGHSPSVGEIHFVQILSELRDGGYFWKTLNILDRIVLVEPCGDRLHDFRTIRKFRPGQIIEVKRRGASRCLAYFGQLWDEKNSTLEYSYFYKAAVENRCPITESLAEIAWVRPYRRVR